MANRRTKQFFKIAFCCHKNKYKIKLNSVILLNIRFHLSNKKYLNLSSLQLIVIQYLMTNNLESLRDSEALLD